MLPFHAVSALLLGGSVTLVSYFIPFWLLRGELGGGGGGGPPAAAALAGPLVTSASF